MIIRQNRQRVLVVDDDRAVLSLLKSILEAGGYTVAAASGALSAAKYLAENRGVDLLVTDIEMPGKTGIELVAEVSKEQPDLAVLFVTGGAATVDLSSGLQRQSILQKPFSASNLLASVRKMLAPVV